MKLLHRTPTAWAQGLWASPSLAWGEACAQSPESPAHLPASCLNQGNFWQTTAGNGRVAKRPTQRCCKMRDSKTMALVARISDTRELREGSDLVVASVSLILKMGRKTVP